MSHPMQVNFLLVSLLNSMLSIGQETSNRVRNVFLNVGAFNSPSFSS